MKNPLTTTKRKIAAGIGVGFVVLTIVAGATADQEPAVGTDAIEAASSDPAPVTEAPVTEAPVTEAPVTEAPVATEPPVTEAPAPTDPPETAPPTTEEFVIDDTTLSIMAKGVITNMVTTEFDADEQDLWCTAPDVFWGPFWDGWVSEDDSFSEPVIKAGWDMAVEEVCG